jgi:hypothetical protein
MDPTHHTEYAGHCDALQAYGESLVYTSNYQVVYHNTDHTPHYGHNFIK